MIQKLRPAALLMVATLLGTALAANAGAAPPPHAKNKKARCVDGTNDARELTVQVPTADGTEAAKGRYALPAKNPTELVVFAHGYGHTSASWVEHMKNAAAKHGVAAVAMDYRNTEISPDSNGDGFPEARGWRVMEGAQDSIAAAQYFEARCPSIEKIVIFGVSMGGNASGLAVALSKDAQRKDGSPLFDYWVDVEGAVNVIETYAGASALESVNDFAAQAKEDIEEEMGGTFQEVPAVYAEHSVVTRIEDIKASGIEGVIVVHGLDDGLVPYNQAREMTSLLASAEIPTDMYTIGRKSAESERETTATGYAGGQLDPEYNSPMAGHSSEKSQTHIVMVTALNRLWGLLDGAAPGPYREFFVDGPTGTYPAL